MRAQSGEQKACPRSQGVQIRTCLSQKQLISDN